MKSVFSWEFAKATEVAAPEVSVALPLVLDLDGTLLRTDLLLETLLQFVKRNPLRLLMVLAWALRGAAHLKHELAARTDIAVELLPINEPLARYARQAAENGRTVVVATAADRIIAERVCTRFSFVSGVLASAPHLNLKGAAKARALRDRYPDGFVYAGDSEADIAVWKLATFGVFAGSSAALKSRFDAVTPAEAEFAREPARLQGWVKALRIHQWAKNGLVFLPILLAGHLLDVRGLATCAAAFVALGVTASATYLINDLFDLEADRAHWSKRSRPCASGELGIGQAAVSSLLLAVLGVTLALSAGGLPLAGALLLYCATSVAYSLRLKRVPLLDVAVLAGLFTLRLGVGSLAAHVRLTAWLGVFSMFLFTSLALAKRSTEIARTKGAAMSAARGYVAADAPLVSALGAGTAVAAILVIVLYLVEDAFGQALYSNPQLLWGTPVLIGLWLGRVWLLCGRGLLNDDPVAFAVRDAVSISLGMGVMACFAGAALLA